MSCSVAPTPSKVHPGGNFALSNAALAPSLGSDRATMFAVRCSWLNETFDVDESLVLVNSPGASLCMFVVLLEDISLRGDSNEDCGCCPPTCLADSSDW